MADVSITAANVQPGATAPLRGVAAAAITAGETLALNSSGLLILASASSALLAAAVGVAMCGAAIGQPVLYQPSGPYTAGGTLTLGATYVVSPNNAGGIAPIGDISSGNYVTVLGVATSTTVLNLDINVSGVAHA